MSWFVVNTHPHKEPTAERHLRQQGYRVFLPSFLRARRHARKTDITRKPLFPCYLFVELDLRRSRLAPIDSTVGVRRLLRHGDTPAAAPAELMSELMMQTDEDGVMQDPSFAPGRAVRITRGPFANVVGTLLNFADRDRVTVLINMLGREMTMTARTAELRAL